MSNFTREQLQSARRADLYQFLRQHHSKDFRVEGISIHPLFNDSISIRRGYSGYKDFATDETGNAVDFLTRYMDYSLVDAVHALSSDTGQSIKKSGSNTEREYSTEFPEPLKGRWTQLYAYLCGRGITAEVIQALSNSKLIYQSADRNNVVFINKKRDYAELRGTYTFAKKPFHGTIRKCPDGYWSFQVLCGTPEKAYVCEGAIDAISLYMWQKSQNQITEPTVYCSIGGASTQDTIERIKKTYKEVILAVDADEAGDKCAARNPELKRLLPVCGKDWNDTLRTRGTK